MSGNRCIINQCVTKNITGPVTSASLLFYRVVNYHGFDIQEDNKVNTTTVHPHCVP